MPRDAETITANPQTLAADQPKADSVLFVQPSAKQLAWADIQDAFKKWRIWLTLANQDIRLRYRRSVLGPLWITLSMAITVYSMGFLYAHLFHIQMKDYYPYLVSSMVSWGLISAAIVELTDTFMTSDGLIKQIKLPYSLYIHRVIARNLLIYFHNLLVMVPIILIFHETAKINFNTLLLVLGLAIFYVNALIYGILLALVGSRYRDISQVIKSLVQVIFFVTPVMWSPKILPEHVRYLLNFNPFYSFLELIRAPLLGTSPTLINFMVALLVTLFGALVCSNLFSRYRARIIYWI